MFLDLGSLAPLILLLHFRGAFSDSVVLLFHGITRPSRGLQEGAWAPRDILDRRNFDALVPRFASIRHLDALVCIIGH